MITDASGDVFDVKIEVAGDPNTPSDVLEELSYDPSLIIKYMVSVNPITPTPIVCDIEDELVRFSIENCALKYFTNSDCEADKYLIEEKIKDTLDFYAGELKHCVVNGDTIDVGFNIIGIDDTYSGLYLPEVVAYKIYLAIEELGYELKGFDWY